MVIFLLPFNRKSLDPGQYLDIKMLKLYLHGRESVSAKIVQNSKIHVYV